MKKLLVFLFIVLFLAILSIYWPVIKSNVSGNTIGSSIYEKEEVFIERVVDGDTIQTNIGNIRLLGINTPEKNNYYYQEAKDYLRKEVENKSILVLRDKEDVDKYKRKLRYLFYGNRIINVEILENGLATSFLTEDLIYKDKLKAAEEFAKKNERGLWERSKDICSSCIELSELNYKNEFFIIKNNCQIKCDLSGWTVKDDANHFFKLQSLNALESKKYDSEEKVWNDDGDRFFMRDKQGKLVVYYSY